MIRRVAVVDHALSFPPLDLAAAVRDEFQIVWVLGHGAPVDATSRRLRERTGVVADLTGATFEEGARALDALGICGVVTFADENYVPTAELAHRLGLPGHTPELALTLASKTRTRAELAARGVPGPRFAALPTAGRESGSAPEGLSYPVVVKPDLSSASRGIRLAMGDAELAAALGDLGGEALVEELLAPAFPDSWHASYVSVESLVHAREARHVAVTGRFPLASGFRETGNFVPALLPDGLCTEVVDVAQRAINALGVTDGALHTEIQLTPDGPKLIEVNGRLGGRPPYVLRDVTGVNLFAETFRLAAGTPPTLAAELAYCGVGFWLMVQAPRWADAVASVGGLDDCARLPGLSSVELHIGPGQPIDHALGTLSRVASFRGVVGDHDELRDTVDAINRTARFSYSGRVETD